MYSCNSYNQQIFSAVHRGAFCQFPTMAVINPTGQGEKQIKERMDKRTNEQEDKRIRRKQVDKRMNGQTEN